MFYQDSYMILFLYIEVSEVTVTNLYQTFLFDAPLYGFSCNLSTPSSYTLTFSNRDVLATYTGWIAHDAGSQKIQVTLSPAQISSATNGEIPIRITATQNIGPALTSSDVIMLIKLNLPCASSDSIELKDPELYSSP